MMKKLTIETMIKFWICIRFLLQVRKRKSLHREYYQSTDHNEEAYGVKSSCISIQFQYFKNDLNCIIKKEIFAELQDIIILVPHKKTLKAG